MGYLEQLSSGRHDNACIFVDDLHFEHSNIEMFHVPIENKESQYVFEFEIATKPKS